MSKVVAIEFCGFEDVYNMEVKEYHNYSACGGLILHNCDSMRGFCLEHTYQVGEPKGQVIYTTEAEWLKATIFDKIKRGAGRVKEMAQAM